jgi:hypothetical protein
MTLPFIGGARTGSNRYFGYIFGAPDCYGAAEAVPYALNAVTLTDETAIDDYAFYNIYGLTTVTLPESLRSIGASAFFRCYTLTEITLPASLQSIGASAFLGCEQLGVVRLSGRPAIEADAFYDCRGLYEVYDLGDLGVTAGSSAFGYLGLNAIAVYRSLTETRMQTHTADGLIFKSHQGKFVLTGYTEDVPADLTLKAFTASDTPIASYRVAPRALRGAPITALTVTDAVTEIGGNAFTAARDLKSADLSASGLRSLADGVFSDSGRLEAVQLPNGLETIGENAFSYCGRLYALTVPASVRSIGGDAFFGCWALADIINLSPLNITAGSDLNGRIGRHALRIADAAPEPLQTDTDGGFRFTVFEGTRYLIAAEDGFADLPDTGEPYVLFESVFYDGSGGMLTIPKSVESIRAAADGAFLFGYMSVRYEGTAAEWAQLKTKSPGSLAANLPVLYSN